jgi:hypothetical protein
MEEPDGKRRRTSTGQGTTYRDKVLKVVKARLDEATAKPNGPALRLPENLEMNGEASSIISQAIWRLGHLQGMLLFGDLRNQQLLPERHETFSWATEERFMKVHNVIMTFLFENCHTIQRDETTMIAAPSHLLRVERMNDLVHSGLQVARARGQLDHLLEQLDAVTARGGPLLRPPPQPIGDEAPATSSGSGLSHSEETERQNSAAIDEEQAFQEHLESLADPLPSGLWEDEYPNMAEQTSDTE